MAYLSGPEASWANTERIRAFEAAAAFGVDVTVIPCGHTARHGYDTADAVRDRVRLTSVPPAVSPGRGRGSRRQSMSTEAPAVSRW
ncbi:hypothetical protein SANT12839_005280 [Streptomyces antimycoticus]|uniref:Uncharacterized protein n=1 Tax=Streptomyces antimycoticus TaxID=68175 RepID=A0A4D4JYZ8_9ACTN|nr:hypothetical protein SANT12839_005280 [Streptomyces antimycoticus]